MNLIGFVFCFFSNLELPYFQPVPVCVFSALLTVIEPSTVREVELEFPAEGFLWTSVAETTGPEKQEGPRVDEFWAAKRVNAKTGLPASRSGLVQTNLNPNHDSVAKLKHISNS